MAGKYHCPCAADVQCEGWHSPIVVSKAREGKQKASQVRPSWGLCLVLGTDVPSHYSLDVPNPFPYLATAGGIAHFHLDSNRLVAA